MSGKPNRGDPIYMADREKAFRKFQSEQMIRMGGNKTPILSVGLSVFGYLFSGHFLGIQKVPYKLIFGIVGYGIGVNMGGKLYGDPGHRVYYT
jgi:hypothetical protein